MLRHDTYDHNYPHCWRCDAPLIYRAIRAWFVRVTELKPRMIAANQKIHGSDELWAIVEHHREWLVQQVLASRIDRLSPDAPGGGRAEGWHDATVDVGDERVDLAIRRPTAA